MDNTHSARDIADTYRRTKRVTRWPVPAEVENAPLVALRNDLARRLADLPVPEILRSYVYLSVAEMERLLALASRHVLREPLHGIGLELGAGTGLLASVVAKTFPVQGILGLELCSEMADRIIPTVASAVLGDRADRVVPVVGTFDDLHLGDDTVDFAVEIDSLHHSADLGRTLRECARVLSPGAWLLCFDRCQPDTLTDEQVDAMLSRTYSPDALETIGYPPDVTLTRRENGEHEYRLFEWRDAFARAGLCLARVCEVHDPIPFHMAAKGLCSVLPRPLRRLLYRNDNATVRTTLLWLAQHVHVRTGLGRLGSIVVGPKATTVFLLRKPPDDTDRGARADDPVTA